jgi:hypothetical protein
MLKLSKIVAVAALALGTLAPGLASAAERVVVVGGYGAPVVERVRVGPPYAYWGPRWRFHRIHRFWR